MTELGGLSWRQFFGLEVVVNEKALGLGVQFSCELNTTLIELFVRVRGEVVEWVAY